jgi:CRISPR-associated protein Cmr6
LEEKTNKGKWKARHDASGLTGPVVNSELVLANAKAGDKLTLLVKSVIGGKSMEFLVPDPSKEASKPGSPSTGKTGHGRGGGRGFSTRGGGSQRRN